MGTWEASAERYNLIGYSYREPCARSMMIIAMYVTMCLPYL